VPQQYIKDIERLSPQADRGGINVLLD